MRRGKTPPRSGSYGVLEVRTRKPLCPIGASTTIRARRFARSGVAEPVATDGLSPGICSGSQLRLRCRWWLWCPGPPARDRTAESPDRASVTRWATGLIPLRVGQDDHHGQRPDPLPPPLVEPPRLTDLSLAPDGTRPI